VVNYSSEVCRVDARKYFFSETVIAPWNSLPAKDEHVTAVNSFRAFSKSSEVLSSSVVFCSYCTLVSDCLWFYHGSCNCLVLWLVPTFSVWFTVYFTHWQINLIWFDWSYDAVSTACSWSVPGDSFDLCRDRSTAMPVCHRVPVIYRLIDRSDQTHGAFGHFCCNYGIF